jgi:small redox-active disulfide protein 2
MEIKILGTGCPKCKRLEQLTHEAVAEAGVEATVTKVTDVDAILAYPILSTPGLVIDEELVASGRLPRKDEIVGWIADRRAGGGA